MSDKSNDTADLVLNLDQVEQLQELMDVVTTAPGTVNLG
jgi:hypothetical protein